jgi:peptidoglycan-associated lipoprotein
MRLDSGAETAAAPYLFRTRDTSINHQPKQGALSMNRCYHPFLSAIALFAAVTALAGCHGGKDKDTLNTVGNNTINTENEALPNVDVTGCVFGDDARLKPVYFDYDSHALTAPTTMTLGHNAELIQEVPGVVIQIAGHCDERGTQEYNLALGEKRAQSVRDHLRQLGVPGDRLITISYGEEAPAVAGSTETAWSQNRRCEFMRATMN